MSQFLGSHQFLKQVVVTLLSLCLSVPMPLFCPCNCVAGQSSCCSVHQVPPDSDKQVSDTQVQTVAMPCCEHCQPKPVSTKQTKKGCCSQPSGDAMDNDSASAPWLPCHCVLQRAPDLNRSNSTDCIAVTLKSVSHAYTIPDYDLCGLTASTSPIERIPSLRPPSHHQRQSLLGTWLN